METKERLTELIRKQISIENINVEKVSETEKKVGYAAAKLFLQVIRADSQKHVDILNGILEILRGIPPSESLDARAWWEYKLESYIDPVLVKRELEDHMKRESEMIVHVEKEITSTKDEGLKQLLNHILDDEKRHHRILKTVVDKLYKMHP